MTDQALPPVDDVTVATTRGRRQSRSAQVAGVGVNQELLDKFWALVKKRTDGDCWQWNGSLRPDGYGTFTACGKRILAFAFAWELEHERVPDGMRLVLECNNRGCVRPLHCTLVKATKGRSGKVFHGKHKKRKYNRELSAVEAVKVSIDPMVHALATSVRDTVRTMAEMGHRLEVARQELDAVRLRITTFDERLKRIESRPVVELSQLQREREPEPPPQRLAEVVQLPVSHQGAPPKVEASAEPPAPPPDPPSLGALLAKLFEEATGSKDGDEEALRDAFDVAITEAGGNGQGGVAMLRGWLLAFVEYSRVRSLKPTARAFREYVFVQHAT